jgi:hypothetical protein
MYLRERALGRLIVEVLDGLEGLLGGRQGDTYLVRNRILSAKGSPTRVDGQYLKLQRDFTLGSGSEQRIRFWTLSKKGVLITR